jgi:hypothetical protein
MKMRYVDNEYFNPVYSGDNWSFEYITKYNILDRRYYPFAIRTFEHKCNFSNKYIKSVHYYNDQYPYNKEKLYLIERQDEISCYLDKWENNLEFKLNQFQKNGFKLKKVNIAD